MMKNSNNKHVKVYNSRLTTQQQGKRKFYNFITTLRPQKLNNFNDLVYYYNRPSKSTSTTTTRRTTTTTTATLALANYINRPLKLKKKIINYNWNIKKLSET